MNRNKFYFIIEVFYSIHAIFTKESIYQSLYLIMMIEKKKYKKKKTPKNRVYLQREREKFLLDDYVNFIDP
jgi:hypothetical protein